MTARYEVRDIDQTAEIAALKAERDRLKEWCRKLIEGGTFPGEADGLRAERDRLRTERNNWEESAKQFCRNADYWRAERDRLQAALEEIANHHWSSDHSKWLARRALDKTGTSAKVGP